MKRIWVTGASGRLGTALKKYLDPIDYEILWTDENAVDITQGKEVTLFAERNRPYAIINTAGYTNPALCEQNPERAFSVNAFGARNLAVQANRVNAKFIHFSTDDVFDGQGTKPYTEFDPVNPQTIYGRSKKAGEDFVREFSMKHFIIRTSWLYSPINRRVETILEEAREKKEVLVADIVSSPTSVYELAQFIVRLLDTEDYGVYHASGVGSVSREELAREILSLAGLEASIKAVDQVGDSAYRPKYSVLDNFSMRVSGIYSMSQWQDGLRKYMEKEGLI